MCTLKSEFLTSVCFTGGWGRISSNVYKQRMNLRCRVILPLHRHTQLNQMLLIKWSPPSLRANVVVYGVIFCKAQTDLNKAQYEEQLISHQNSRNYGGINLTESTSFHKDYSSSATSFLILFLFSIVFNVVFLLVKGFLNIYPGWPGTHDVPASTSLWYIFQACNNMCNP